MFCFCFAVQVSGQTSSNSFLLTVQSQPVNIPVTFGLNETFSTPFSMTLVSENYQFTMPQHYLDGDGVAWVFTGWSDGFTNNTRNVQLIEALTFTALYVTSENQPYAMLDFTASQVIIIVAVFIGCIIVYMNRDKISLRK